jgi:predicted DNA-binding protein (MmcQ/YjbR family)
MLEAGSLIGCSGTDETVELNEAREEPVGADATVKTSLTAEEWLMMEKEMVCRHIDDNTDPLAYLKKELARKDNPENRLATLNRLVSELNTNQKKARKAEENNVDLEVAGEVSYQQPLEERMEVLKGSAFAYVEARKMGLQSDVPALAFLLTREDVLDYLDKMKEDSKRFPVEPYADLRQKRHLPDVLKCGVWTFAMVYEKDDVIKFITRMDDSFQQELTKSHTGTKVSLFPKGDNWYDVIVDGSYVSKNEVFHILDRCYDFVLNRYYKMEADSRKYVTDEETARKDSETLHDVVLDNAYVTDPVFDQAISEHKEALVKYRMDMAQTFSLSRDRILEYIRKWSPETIIVERPKVYMPASMKYARRTYALIYERFATVRMIVRIQDGLAKELSLRHPLLTRAKFPKNRNWYSMDVDGSFEKPQQVFLILRQAQNYVFGGAQADKQHPKYVK